MGTTKPIAMSRPLLHFIGLYVLLRLVVMAASLVLPPIFVRSMGGFIGVMCLIVPAVSAARKIIANEARAPTIGESIKLALASYLISTLIDGVMISGVFLMQGMAISEQFVGFTTELRKVVGSADFPLLAAVLLGFAVVQIALLTLAYRMSDRRGAVKSVTG